jgi:hypothetical protein
MIATENAAIGGQGSGPAARSKGPVTPEPISLVALWAAFTIWVAIASMFGFLGCVIVPLLLGANSVSGNRFSIAPRLSTRSLADRVAWVVFTCGVWAMLWTALRALVGDSDRDFRSWDEIRRQVRILQAAGSVAIGAPVIVSILQYFGWVDGARPAEPRRAGKGEGPSPLLDLPAE